MRTHFQLQVSQQRYKRQTTNVVDNAAYHSASSFGSIPSVLADEHKCWAVRRLSQETCWPIEQSLFCLPHPALSLEAPAQENPLEFLDETYPQKTRGMGLLYGENCVILASAVFDWSTRVTDGWTDGIAIAYTRYSYAVTRKNEVAL